MKEPRTVACPRCKGPVTIEEEPKDFVDRAVDQIWFAGGMIAMLVVCVVGFGVASCLVCVPFWLVWCLITWLWPGQ
jgi:hypothetical protein